ncbi:MAG: hypothetical protein WD851_01505 [Pirellulales bacterium]
MSALRIAGLHCVLLASVVPSAVRADYVFSTLWGLVRYSDDGQLLFNYRTGGYYPGDESDFIDEAMLSIGLGPNRRVYALGNSLGTISLHEFDADTGLEISRKFTDEYGSEYNLPLWQSSSFFADHNPQCGTGCSGAYIKTGHQETGILFHPDGHLYSFGAAEFWAYNSQGQQRYDHLEHALVRFSVANPSPPDVVTLLDNSVVTDVPWRDLVMAPDGSTYFRQPYSSSDLLKVDSTLAAGAEVIVSLPPGSHSLAFSPDGLLNFITANQVMRFDVESQQFLGTFIDLNPFGALSPYRGFYNPFFDDRGRFLVMMGTSDEEYYNWSTSLLEFDTQSGAFRRTVFTEKLGDDDGFFHALYLPVPEPSSAILAAIGLAIVYGIRFSRNLKRF